MDIAITVSNREIKPAVINFFQHENQTVVLNFTLDSYMYEEVDLRNYKAYGVTVQNGLVDMTELEMNYNAADDKLVLSWEVQEYSLRQEGAITYQIVFKENADDGENTAVFYTYKGIMINRGSVDGDNHITANYPTILKQWLDKIEELAGTMEAGIIYIPYDETIPVSDRLDGRVYFQFTDAYNIGGRFEDHEGKELKLNDYLSLTGNQTVEGVKTFSSSPKVPNITDITDNSQKVANTNFVQNIAYAASQQIASVGKQISDLDGVVVKSVNSLTPDSAGDVTVSTIKANGSDSFSQVRGGASVSDGARLNVFGKDYAENPGDFSLIANDGTNSKSLIGKPTGELSWDGNPIVTCSTAGTILNKGTTIIKQDSNGSYTQIFGGETYLNGAYLRLNGKNEASGGGFVLASGDGTKNNFLKGLPDGTLTWNGKDVLTSGGGTFEIQKNSNRPEIILRRTDMNTSTALSTSGTVWMGVIRYGFSDATYAYVEAGKNTNNKMCMQMVATADNSTYYNIGVQSDGTTNAPTPTSATDNSTKIATTAWCQKSRREGYGAGIPNYSAGVTVTNNFTFTANGVIRIKMYQNGGTAYAYLNGIEVYHWTDDGNSMGTSIIPVKKGQKFTHSNGLQLCIFYPYL